MRRANLSREQAKQIMETINPLGLYDSNKRLTIYKSAVECYTDCLTTLFLSAPRGYIDIALFMLKHQLVPLHVAVEYCKHQEYAIVNWEAANSARTYTLKKLIMILLKVTDIEFSENAFKGALYVLDEFITNFYKQR